MNIFIMSRAEIIRFAMQKHIESFAVISIRDVGSYAPSIIRTGNGIETVLFLTFDDVEEGEKNCMTEQDAKKIALFIKSNDKLYSNLIVHCEYGQSRSAGVAAAISKKLNNNDKWVFEDERYYVNLACYWKTLRAIEAPSWKKILDKLVLGMSKCNKIVN